MDKINDIKFKYRLNIEDLIPDENLLDEIKIIEKDIGAIDWCLTQNKNDKDVVAYGQKFKQNLIDKLEYLKDKLKEFLRREALLDGENSDES